MNMGLKNEIVLKKIREFVRQENIKINEPLKNHTSFKIGGNCIALIKPQSQQELISLLTFFNNKRIRFFVIGNGTNLLVRDKGVKAFIIKLSKNFSHIEQKDNIVEVCSGTSLRVLADYCIKKGLSGLEFSYGIPGSVGGAVYMNAGAYGGQISNVIKNVTAFNGKKVVTLNKEQLHFSYRKSIFQKKPNYIILKVEFEFAIGEQEKIKEVCQLNLQKRKENHPLNFPSAGSVFKRHKMLIPSKTIDELGLKGYRIGGAEVSEKHAGFIINRGNATSKDVLELVKYIQKCVFKKYKKRIKMEIKVLGD